MNNKNNNIKINYNMNLMNHNNNNICKMIKIILFNKITINQF